MIDFHCHLDLYPNPPAVRDECVRRGLYVLSVTTTPSAWKGTSALATDTERIRTGLGLHPQLAHERQNELALFDSFLPDTCYVGEIGLDATPEFRSHWQSQVAVFEHVLAKCHASGGRIMSLHSRRASGAVLDYLEKFPQAGTPILHWFSGSFRDLDRAIDLGCWFSIGPVMLASEKGRALAARMPRERVLTESDGPFAQLNGEAVKPWDVEKAIHKLGMMWSLRPDEVDRSIHQNLKCLIEMTDSFVYFAYGSNMLSRRLRKRTPSAVAIGTGFVKGHRLTFDKVSSDGSGKCNIAAAKNPMERVYGVLFRINSSEAERLDNTEGLGRGYRKCELHVVTPTGTSPAVAYIADRTDPLLLPYDWYKEFVITGAVEHQLPGNYIDGLRSIASRRDPDAGRDAENRATLS